MIKFGVMLPHRWLYASKENILKVASLALNHNFDSVWVTDHVCVPESHLERGHIFYESLITLTYVASKLDGLKLGTCVLVLPIRNPLLLAKQLATLDRLSEKGIILGVGAGWIEEELKAFGIDPKIRGLIEEEAIKVLRKVWDNSLHKVSFHGRFFNFSDLIFYPKPKNKIPIWVGGNSLSSIKRAIKLGDGWIPWAINSSKIIEGKRIIEKNLKERKITIALATPIGLNINERSYTGALGEKHYYIAGNVKEVINQIEDYIMAGVEYFVCSFRDIRVFKDEKIDFLIKDLKVFAKEIMPSF